MRLDSFRGGLAADLLARLPLADDDADLGEALDRWELSLFQSEPFRSEQLREALAALLGGTDGLWAAALRGRPPRRVGAGKRGTAFNQLRALAAGEPVGAGAADTVRRALVEALAHGDRPRLVDALDESLLGLRPRPSGYFARRAASSATA